MSTATPRAVDGRGRCSEPTRLDLVPRSHSVAVRADEVALCNLRKHTPPRDSHVGGQADREQLLGTLAVIKVHHVGVKPASAVSARTILERVELLALLSARAAHCLTAALSAATARVYFRRIGPAPSATLPVLLLLNLQLVRFWKHGQIISCVANQCQESEAGRRSDTGSPLQDLPCVPSRRPRAVSRTKSVCRRAVRVPAARARRPTLTTRTR